MRTRLPDTHGHFGISGGRYAVEALMPALFEREDACYTAESAFGRLIADNGRCNNLMKIVTEYAKDVRVAVNSAQGQ